MVIAKGGMAGIIGTAALTAGMQGVPVLLQRVGLVESEAMADEQEEPTEVLAEKVADGVLQQPIGGATRRVSGQTIHWGYGAAWGALYGVVQSSLRPPHWLHGTLLGAGMAVIASTLVPAMQLTPPPTKQPIAMSAMQFGLHLIYGLVTAFAFRYLSKDE